MTTRQHVWLRHYATSRKVAGLIPDEIIGFFNWPNPSSRTVALGSTQPLAEMSTRNFPWGKERPTCKADHHTTICDPTFQKSVSQPPGPCLIERRIYQAVIWQRLRTAGLEDVGALTSHTPKGLHGLLQGQLYLLLNLVQQLNYVPVVLSQCVIWM
jgi:hypothetical protein